MSKPRRQYTREFKLAAVKLITEQGRSVAEAARSLDVSEKQLRHSKAVLHEQGQHAFPGNGHLPAADEELRRLREENQRLRLERDFLKKATAFFAKESL
jgi:transposase